MNTFYTILYATINPLIQEQLAIGLLLSGEKNIFFKYSNEKLKNINPLIPKHAKSLLKDSLKNIEHSVKQLQSETGKIPPSLPFDQTQPRIFMMQFIEYLSRYNHNLLTFSKPVGIDIPMNNNLFNQLYRKYIGIEKKPQETQKNDIKQELRNILYPKIQKNVNIERKITHTDIDTLIIPVDVSFIGKNGYPVVGKSIDFQIPKYNLESDIGHYISLIKAFDEQYNNGKFFMIGQEPSKSDHKVQHNLWTQIRDLKYIDFVQLQEIDTISGYIHKNQVQPFFGD